MNLEDLRKLIHLGASQNIHQSANALHITPGALSKIVKKIESQWQTTLFDRVGRHIELNHQGKLFIKYAINLIHEYDQMRSEFIGTKAHQVIKLIAPAILVASHIEVITRHINSSNQSLDVTVAYENEAIKKVINGQADLALVTEHAIEEWHQLDLSVVKLGTLPATLCTARNQTIPKQPKLTISELLERPFVCPTYSPFCGDTKGIGSDGWPDHLYPRKIACRSDDFHSLIQLVKQNNVLAYLPKQIAQKEGLTIINVEGMPQYLEHVCLIYRPSMATGWLNQLSNNIRQ